MPARRLRIFHLCDYTRVCTDRIFDVCFKVEFREWCEEWYLYAIDLYGVIIIRECQSRIVKDFKKSLRRAQKHNTTICYFCSTFRFHFEMNVHGCCASVWALSLSLLFVCVCYAALCVSISGMFFSWANFDVTIDIYTPHIPSHHDINIGNQPQTIYACMHVYPIIF